MRWDIDVSADDIAAGWRRNCDLCPIARAVRRGTGATGISVAVHRLRMEVEGRIFHGVLPQQAREAITTFDQDLAIKPFSFVLEAEEYRRVSR